MASLCTFTYEQHDYPQGKAQGRNRERRILPKEVPRKGFCSRTKLSFSSPHAEQSPPPPTTV